MLAFESSTPKAACAEGVESDICVFAMFAQSEVEWIVKNVDGGHSAWASRVEEVAGVLVELKKMFA